MPHSDIRSSSRRPPPPHSVAAQGIRAALAACCLAGVAAAGADGQQAPRFAAHAQVMLHDSAFAAAASGHGWSLELTRGADGTLYVSVFGRGVVAVEPGEAPRWLRMPSGERVSSGDLSWAGDTLAVSGWHLWRRFGVDGTDRGCTRFQARGEFSTQVFPRRLLPGGLALGELLPPFPGSIGPRLVVSRNQQVIRSLYERPPEPRPIRVPLPRGGASLSVRPPLRADTLWSTASNASGVAVVEQVAPRAAGTQRVRVLRLGLDGETVFRAGVHVPVIATTAPWSRRQYAEMARAFGNGLFPVGDPDTVAAALERHAPNPPFHPPVTAVVAGDDGSAWLRLSTEGDDVEWVALDRTGREIGRVELPADFTGLFADASGLWGFRSLRPGEMEVLVASPGAPPFASPVEIQTDGYRPGRIALGGCTE